jgi:hypothetical protein
LCYDFPDKNYEEVLITARSMGVRYVVVDENIDALSPGFWKNIEDKDLVVLKKLEAEEQKTAIFEIIYPKG